MSISGTPTSYRALQHRSKFQSVVCETSGGCWEADLRYRAASVEFQADIATSKSCSSVRVDRMEAVLRTPENSPARTTAATWLCQDIWSAVWTCIHVQFQRFIRMRKERGLKFKLGAWQILVVAETSCVCRKSNTEPHSSMPCRLARTFHYCVRLTIVAMYVLLCCSRGEFALTLAKYEDMSSVPRTAHEFRMQIQKNAPECIKMEVAAKHDNASDEAPRHRRAFGEAARDVGMGTPNQPRLRVTGMPSWSQKAAQRVASLRSDEHKGPKDGNTGSANSVENALRSVPIRDNARRGMGRALKTLESVEKGHGDWKADAAWPESDVWSTPRTTFEMSRYQRGTQDLTASAADFSVGRKFSSIEETRIRKDLEKTKEENHRLRRALLEKEEQHGRDMAELKDRLDALEARVEELAAGQRAGQSVQLEPLKSSTDVFQRLQRPRQRIACQH